MSEYQESVAQCAEFVEMMCHMSRDYPGCAESNKLIREEWALFSR